VNTFEIVKFVHILTAIIAVGFNASYGILLTRAAREPEHQLHVVRTVKVLDDRFANPGYAVLLATGIWMVLISPYQVSDLWIVTALVLYGLAVLGGALGYTPTLRREIALLESGQGHSEEFRGLAKRGQTIGILLAIDVIAIVFLMVTKPTL
jgi:uncharacterized membrane protein